MECRSPVDIHWEYLQISSHSSFDEVPPSFPKLHVITIKEQEDILSTATLLSIWILI